MQKVKTSSQSASGRVSPLLLLMPIGNEPIKSALRRCTHALLNSVKGISQRIDLSILSQDEKGKLEAFNASLLSFYSSYIRLIKTVPSIFTTKGYAHQRICLIKRWFKRASENRVRRTFG